MALGKHTVRAASQKDKLEFKFFYQALITVWQHAHVPRQKWGILTVFLPDHGIAALFPEMPHYN